MFPQDLDLDAWSDGWLSTGVTPSRVDTVPLPLYMTRASDGSTIFAGEEVLTEDTLAPIEDIEFRSKTIKNPTFNTRIKVNVALSN